MPFEERTDSKTELLSMKVIQRILSYALICCMSFSTWLLAETSNNYAIQISDLLDTVNQKDLWAVREWLRSKRVAFNNKTGDFSIAGDVKTTWRNAHEHLGSVNIINGPSSASGWPNNMYTVDFRLYFDYKADKTWASVKLDFDEAAGLFGGQANNLALVRANMGYHLYDDCNMRFDVMVGRQRAYEIYDSQLQFNSTLDGFTGLFSMGLEGLADISIRGGGYIFNAVLSQPIWAIQAGLYDILDTGFYTEYAFTNWSKHTNGVNLTNNIIPAPAPIRAGSDRWAYRLNQFILGYMFNPEVFGREVKLFGGFLWNALARARAMQRLSNGLVDSSQNLGGWVALQIGSVQKAGDWALQAQWQVAQPYSVPDWDMAGMGRGNGIDSTLFGVNQFTKVGRLGGLPVQGNGNAGYNGWELDGLYSVTNELVLEFRLQRALGSNGSIGFSSNYTNFRLAAIYGF